MKKRTVALVVATVFASAVAAQTASTQDVETRIGKFEFELGVPTKATVEKLYDQMDFQRASQLYIWALPIVGAANLQAILAGTTGALPGDLTIYTGNSQSVFLTANAITPYIVSYLDLAKAGPVVMDIPAGAIAGSAGSVSMYAINAATGALASIGTIAAGTDPVSVAVDPAGKFAYVTNSGANDVSMYSIGATGTLTLIGTIGT